MNNELIKTVLKINESALNVTGKLNEGESKGTDIDAKIKELSSNLINTELMAKLDALKKQAEERHKKWQAAKDKVDACKAKGKGHEDELKAAEENLEKVIKENQGIVAKINKESNEIEAEMEKDSQEKKEQLADLIKQKASAKIKAKADAAIAKLNTNTEKIKADAKEIKADVADVASGNTKGESTPPEASASKETTTAKETSGVINRVTNKETSRVTNKETSTAKEAPTAETPKVTAKETAAATAKETATAKEADTFTGSFTKTKGAQRLDDLLSFIDEQKSTKLNDENALNFMALDKIPELLTKLTGIGGNQ